MQPKINFCSRCRGMAVGWNRRYILHCLLCKHWLRNSSRFCGLVVLTSALLLAFPAPSATVYTSTGVEQPVHVTASKQSVFPVDVAAVQAMGGFLKLHGIPPDNRGRLAESIVRSAMKHNLNPRLLASVMIVESRGNQFAISGKDAIGIMQIHLPTWGCTADREGINLLKIEDNIDFGARILKGYIRQFGVVEGVKRYNGFVAVDPGSENSVPEYVARVQRVYEAELR